jgi:hypothetical protein
LPPSPARIASRELDASVGASGPHGIAVRKVSAFVFGAACVHRILPRVRDDLEPPLQWDRTARVIQVICDFGKSEYFLKRGLTEGSKNSPGDLPVGLRTRSVASCYRPLMRLTA